MTRSKALWEYLEIWERDARFHFVCTLEDKIASAAGGLSRKTTCLAVVCEQVQRQKLMVDFILQGRRVREPIIVPAPASGLSKEEASQTC